MIKTIDTPEGLRSKLAALKAQQAELSTVHQQIRKVERALAMQTAIAFVAIDSSKAKGVYGISPEVTVRSDCGLSLGVGDETKTAIKICCHVTAGRLEFRLSMDGGQLSFTVMSYEDENDTASYLVRSFAKEYDAEAWLRKRGLEHICR